MRKPKPNDRQFGLDFGPKPSREPAPVPAPAPKEIQKPTETEVGAIYRNAAPEITDNENDKDEDPRAQAAREWREARGRRRA